MGLGDWIDSAHDWIEHDLLGRESLDDYQERTGDKSITGSLHRETDNVVKDTIGDPIKNSLVRVAQGWDWLYSNAISQPISTALLQTQREDQGDFFSASEWSKAWTAAENVSVGQAFQVAMKPWESAQLTEDIVNTEPALRAPAAFTQAEGWDELDEEEQQRILREAGVTDVVNPAIEEHRKENAFFKYSSGLTDFTFRWYADPVILGGKGLGMAKEKVWVKPRPSKGWTRSEIAENMNSSAMAKTRDWIFQNRDNPALVNNLTMFRKSAMGPRAGGVVSKLKSKEEVDLFLRAGMGDVRARVALEEMNAAAARRIQQDLSRLPALDLSASRVASKNDPRAASMILNRMETLRKQIRADDDLAQRTDAALKHFGELDALNVSRFSTQRAMRRTKAQKDYRTGPAFPYDQMKRKRGDVEVSKISSDFFNGPLMVMRSLKEARPNGRIAVDDITPEAVAELRGHVARIPGIGPEARQDILNRYLASTTEGQRLDILDQVGALGAKKIAEKHGVDLEYGLALYRENSRKLAIERSALKDKALSAAYGDQVDDAGHALRVDAFLDDGGKIAVHPNLATKLANDHILMDLAELDRVIGRHSGAMKAIKSRGGNAADMLVELADGFSSLWKFSVLFRLGYIPRTVGDDLAGQIARLGAADMALRAGYGTKNLATNLAQWKPKSFHEAREASLREGVKYADDEIKSLIPEARALRRRSEHELEMGRRSRVRANDRLRRAERKERELVAAGAAPGKIRAAQRLVTKHREAAATAQARMDDSMAADRVVRAQEVENRIATLKEFAAKNKREADEARRFAQQTFTRHTQLSREPEARGVKLPPAFGGERGEFFQKMISSDRTMRNLFDSNKRALHRNLQESYSSAGKVIDYHRNAEKFVRAWHKAVNHQIMQDALAVQAVKGASVDDMAKWLSTTPQGRAYRRRLGLKRTPDEQIAANAWHEVNQYLPTWEVRQAAIKGEADEAFLRESAENGARPAEVHTTELGEALAGTNVAARTADRVMDRWYKFAATMPADRMSRHPLFNQLYEGHAKALVEQEFKQIKELANASKGRKGTERTATAVRQAVMHRKDADRIAETARRLALRDTRNLVFDIAHRSDAAAALRFISPFFAATTEAWQRWARIIGDKPQTVGYGLMFFNAPASMGMMVDRDGNRVGPDGYATDPITGKRRLVSKQERMIQVRLPKVLMDSGVPQKLGINPKGDFLISQDSMNVITQGDPWFNPGTGPIVAFTVNELVRDKPKQAELARHLGVLPFGPETSTLFGDGPLGRAAAISAPAMVKNFLTAFDTSDSRYQRIKLHIMQKAAWEHETLGKPMPSAEEISDRVRNYWLRSAAWSFVQPASTTRPDRFEFYRQQYRKLRRKNYLTADQEFIERFGESYFNFAASTSDTSIPPTERAAELFQENRDLIAQNPELASLIIGPNADGPFSPEAWAYSLTTPLVPGDSEMSTRRLSAEEAMKENERRKGWAQFTSAMNAVTAQLHNAGFESFADEGAEKYKQAKQAITMWLGAPTLPDGSENESYNEEWSKDFYSLDPKKYDRLIPNLAKVASSRLAQNPLRTDLRSLQNYIAGREAITAELQRRAADGGAQTLAAQANADLAAAWAKYVDLLIERDTRFGDLHHRYLSRDMGIDVAGMVE